MGAELFHTDGRTDMTQLIVAFRHFANAPKNVCICNMHCAVLYSALCNESVAFVVMTKLLFALVHT